MLRISHCLAFAAGAAVLLVQPALADGQSGRAHHAGYRHYRYGAAYGHRDLGATLIEVSRSWFYGPLGAYEDSYAAWQYPGRNQRHYFGYGWDPRYGYGYDRRSELDGAGSRSG
jgi:hypothetical protein